MSGQAGAGAAIGAASGLLFGSLFGLQNSAAAAGSVQSAYNMAYAQCMAAEGNRVPPPAYPGYPPPAPIRVRGDTTSNLEAPDAAPERFAFASAHANRSRLLFSRVIHPFGSPTFGDYALLRGIDFRIVDLVGGSGRRGRAALAAGRKQRQQERQHQEGRDRRAARRDGVLLFASIEERHRKLPSTAAATGHGQPLVQFLSWAGESWSGPSATCGGGSMKTCGSVQQSIQPRVRVQ